MPYLTTETAKQHIGEKIDSDKRLHHYYPMEIIECKDGSGTLLLRDRAGVCQHIDDEVPFHWVWYDFFLRDGKRHER